MRYLEFTVRGLPAPQGSKSAHSICHQDAQLCRNCRRRHIVKINQQESSKAVKPWRAAVKAAALDNIESGFSGWEPIAGPVLLRVRFTFTRPKSHYRTGKFAHLLRDDAPPFPISPPDTSKLVRSTEDALTDAGVWKDDSLVVETLSSKAYAGEGMNALPYSGAWISVTEMNGDTTA